MWFIHAVSLWANIFCSYLCCCWNVGKWFIATNHTMGDIFHLTQSKTFFSSETMPLWCCLNIELQNRFFSFICMFVSRITQKLFKQTFQHFGIIFFSKTFFLSQNLVTLHFCKNFKKKKYLLRENKKVEAKNSLNFFCQSYLRR